MSEALCAQTHALALDVVAAAPAGAELALNLHPVERWAAVVNHLLDLEQFDAAKYALQRLSPLHPQAEFVQNLSVVLEHLPAAPAATPFFDDTTREVQIARRPASDAALILFCGAGTHRLGVPLNAFHRWAGDIPATLIYLRDFRHKLFLDGVPALGSGLEATLAGLHRLLQELGVRRTFCYGFSVGGFAALLYGLLLRAQRVLALAPAVTLEPRFNAHLRWAQAARRASGEFPALDLNLVQQYTNAAATPRATLVYGEQNWDDRLHAEYMAPVRYVELHPLAGFAGHNPTIELIRRRRLGSLFGEVFGE